MGLPNVGRFVTITPALSHRNAYVGTVGCVLVAWVSLVLAAQDCPALDSSKSPCQYSLARWYERTDLLFESVRAIYRTRNDYLCLGAPAALSRFEHHADVRPQSGMLRVDVSDSAGVRNTRAAFADVNPRSHWYQTWWWRGLVWSFVALTIGGLAYAVHRWRAMALKTKDDARQYVEKLAESNVDMLAQQEALARENTERRRAEEEAGRERDLLHALMDNIPDLIYFKDAQSRFLRINQAQARALGVRTAEEAVGKTDAHFFEEDYARATLGEELELFQSGRPILGKLERESRNGRWLLATKVPLRDNTGGIVGLVGISRDITERKEAEEKLARDLQAFQRVVDDVARGDLTRRGEESDETIGQIARSVNAMLAGFASILADARDAAFSVSSSSSEILSAATQIAKGAEHGSDQTQATSSAVEEMARSMAQVSKDARASAESARQVLEHVGQSDAAVDAAHLSMTKIDVSVLETAEKMRLFGQRSREIFGITGLIEEVASQSRLLSLNAAIEAAHAGDAGRGFAVVAEEVRRLADSSAQAAKDASGRIEGIIQETQAILQAMENATREVTDGRSLSDQARKSLREISTLAEDSVSLAMQISDASHQQAEATQTVVQAMQTISNFTTESASGAKETSKAVRDLVQLAEQLNQAISRFKIHRPTDT
ncbi:MAG: PAS domain-containing protein [Vicinamibacteria bacterium]|nr:PAS domain-containing protein [Vicinamibacteria bacterium]